MNRRLVSTVARLCLVVAPVAYWQQVVGAENAQSGETRGETTSDARSATTLRKVVVTGTPESGYTVEDSASPKRPSIGRFQ